ncbi:MAG TPA: YaiI/YqxD family protein [Ruminiclostridium sp.]|nr:YaiI/YqxD family protein [Ruminiclostridium sp.]
MQILVDADACPVKDIIVRNAKKRGVPVTMIIDTSHELYDGYSTVITVDKARDSVDIKLINLVKRGDIVVTQDYGVAAMGLGKGARVLNQNGLVYSDSNIDRLLFERHLGQKVRRAGGRTGTIKKRSRENDEAFETVFVKLLESENT